MNAIGKLLRPATAWALCTLVPAVSAMELQGHRGARGLRPENTLPAFAEALAIGVHALELDVGVTADGVVVVSHDPRLNPDITRDETGAWLDGRTPALRSLTLERLRTYDVGRIRAGTRYHRQFPDQRPVDGTSIPTLAEVIDLTRRADNEAVRFNVEIKLNPVEPRLFLPPEAFAESVARVLRSQGVARRATVQSFDWRVLAPIRRLAPEITLACLTVERDWHDNLHRGEPGPSPWTAGLDLDDYSGSVPRLVKAAGADVWSPYHRDLDADSLAEAQGLGLSVIVWTVNDARSVRRLIEMGVDGIISDYPDRLRRVMQAARVPVPEPTPMRRGAR